MRCPPIILLVCSAACSSGSRERGADSPRSDTVVVYAAASLAGPMRTALDSFALHTGTVVQEENGASIELARRIIDLHRVPDLIALADAEVFPELLSPASASWYARFARNRMVVAYTDRSRAAREVNVSNWFDVLMRHDVLVGRSDPAVAPAGYRALLLYALAERRYRRPGLAAGLAAASPPALIRGSAAELAALLEAGEVDYIVEYESLARSHRFRWLTLPAEIDLGDPARAAEYANARVTIQRGRTAVTITGAPILYGLSVPRDAPHPGAGMRFAAFLLGPEGRRILRSTQVDVLDTAVVVGDSVPALVLAASRP